MFNPLAITKLFKKIPCLTQTIDKIDTLFETKIPKKHTLAGRTSPLSPYKGVPPGGLTCLSCSRRLSHPSGRSRGGARGVPGPALFCDQTEARRAEKKFWGDPPPPYLKVWMTVPPPLPLLTHVSQGLDPPLHPAADLLFVEGHL